MDGGRPVRPRPVSDPAGWSGSLADRMFDTLSNRFDGIVKRLRGKGRLTEADVDEVLREIRTALLEADVNVGVVRDVVGPHPRAGDRRRAVARRSTRASRSSRSSTTS